MRGRTWWCLVGLFDEAQNTTIMQMKTFLTCLGFNLRWLSLRYRSQIGPKPRNVKSGLIDAQEKLKNIHQGLTCSFSAKDGSAIQLSPSDYWAMNQYQLKMKRKKNYPNLYSKDSSFVLKVISIQCFIQYPYLVETFRAWRKRGITFCKACPVSVYRNWAKPFRPVTPWMMRKKCLPMPRTEKDALHFSPTNQSLKIRIILVSLLLGQPLGTLGIEIQKANGKFIGTIDLHKIDPALKKAAIGYIINKSVWRQKPIVLWLS